LQRPKKGGRLLELGTGAGVGTAWLLDGMDQESELITVDISAEYQQAAREAFAGDKRLEMVNCDAAKFLERQSTESFDLVFADAMPGKFFWLDEALALVKGGGFYVVDDLLPQENWPADHAPKVERLIEKLISLVNFRSVPLAWSSGIIFSFGSNFWFPEKALEDMRNFCGCAWTKKPPLFESKHNRRPFPMLSQLGPIVWSIRNS